MIWKEFCKLIAQLRSEDEVRFFLSDLLNRQERLMLARRVHIASLLESGGTYHEIEEILHAGRPTIARVQRWLNFGRDGYRRVVKLLSTKDQKKLAARLRSLYQK